MTKNVLVVSGHPHGNSFCNSLAEAYVKGAESQATSVKYVRLSDLTLDARGPRYEKATPPAPDVQQFQADLSWAHHIVFVYPIWWGTAPGFFRSLLESALLPGFAFKYHRKGLGWDKLLKGRTAECIVTMDTPPLAYRWLFGRAGDRVMVERTLEFCGIKVRRMTHFGPVHRSTPQQRQSWIEKAFHRGALLSAAA